MPSLKHILFSKHMAMALGLMLVLFALQYCGIEVPCMVFAPIIIIMQIFSDTKTHMVFKALQVVSTIVGMLIGYAIIYL